MINDKEFKQIKSLLSVGIAIRKVVEVTDRSSSVVSAISKCDTFEDYKEYNRQRVLDYQASKKEEPTKVATHDGINSIVAVMKAIEYQQKKTNETLEKIVEHFNRLT